MLVFGAMNASAQLTVYHNGNVNIGSEQPTSNVSLSVGNVAYIPYTMYVLDGDFVYLQNRNIDSDAKITGTEIIAGSHVDSNQPAGSVTIRRGQAILETKNGAIIKNDFKVFKGGAMRLITKK